VALGLWEAYNYDLLSEKVLSACRLSADQLPRINNPLSEDWAVLRPSLIPGLLKSAQYNLSRGAEAVRFFEIGKVYSMNGTSPVERWMVSGLILGPVLDERWQSARSPRAGFPDAKAVVEDLLSRENKIDWVKLGDQPTSALFHPLNATIAMVSGHPVATVGWLHPRVARAFDLEKENAVIFEADLDWLATRPLGRVQFKAFSAYPISRRDLALVVDKATAYAQIESSVRNCAIAELQDLRLFDVYDGKGIGEGKKSLAIRLTFVGREKTLTDADINGFIDRILAAVTQNTGAVLRR
jgi:phenylalanyl-tRNA synthetase beta chain